MPSLTDFIPLLILADPTFLRTLLSAGILYFLLRNLSAQPIPLHHASSTRLARNPAGRFLSCHRVLVVFRS